MERSPAIKLALCLLLALAQARADESGATSEDLPAFHQLHSLIRSNLNGLSEAQLNRAAVLGLLSQLQTQVILVTNGPSGPLASETTLLSKTAIFDGAHAYLRLSGLRPGSAHAVAQAFDQLRSSNKLSGLVLDLRFAAGDDYAEAAAVADLFLTTDQLLLKWGDSTKRSTIKTNSVDVPVVMLVNQKTAGAAEALAATLRDAHLGLIVGSPTAGHAHVFKEFPLGNGQRVRIAAGRIEVGDGHPLSENGITPDIRVNVNEEAERKYLEDPYRVLPTTFVQSGEVNSPGDGTGASATEPGARRRPNESSLIRQRRDNDDDADSAPAPAAASARLLVQDPPLGRALDVLKGLALVRSRR